jgi:hypothetical protein
MLPPAMMQPVEMQRAPWSAPLVWARKKGHGDIARDLSAAGAVEN